MNSGYYYFRCLKQSLPNEACTRNTEMQQIINMDHRERESHVRGLFPTQYTSDMGTARVKNEDEFDTRIIAKE